MPWSRPIKRVNPERRKKNWLRAYGGVARMRWVTRRQCVVCGLEPSAEYPNQNHHVRTGGTSRKADAIFVVALCPPCHHAHETGTALLTRETWDAYAAATELDWQAYCDGGYRNDE